MALKGWQGEVLLNGAVFASVESADVSIDNGVDPYYALGSRQADDVREGNEEITGTINRAWIDDTILSLAFGNGGTIPKFDLYLRNEKGVSGSQYVYLFQCLAETSDVSMPQDDFDMNGMDFRATSAIYGQVP